MILIANTVAVVVVVVVGGAVRVLVLVGSGCKGKLHHDFYLVSTVEAKKLEPNSLNPYE